MSRFLLIHHPPDGGEVRFELEPGATYRVGAKADNDFVIPNTDVSRHHAILRVGDGRFHITDLNSKNGTFVNGTRVSDATVRCGDMIGLSSARLVVVEASSGAYASVPGPLGDGASRDESSEDTSEQSIVVPTEEVIALFEDVADAIPRGALAAPLAWAVRNLAVDAALLLYTDGRGGVSLLTSAGDLGPWATEAAMMANVVLEHAPSSGGRSRVRHVSALGEELLISRVSDEHVVLFRCGSTHPPIADVRVVVLATSLGLTAGGLGRRGPAVRVDSVDEASGGVADSVLIGSSTAIGAVRTRAEELAASGDPVAVVGEPGVGKRALALMLHRAHGRRRDPAVVVTCDSAVAQALCAASVPRQHDLSDVWERARRGSLVLLGGDRLPVEAWRSILERASRPESDVRVLTTWREGGRAVDELPSGMRRLRMPPLRERPEDIALLVSRWSEQDGGSVAWTAACLQVLGAYEWPDNLRELHAEVMRILAVHPRDRAVDVADLAPRLRGDVAGGPPDLGVLQGLPLGEARRRFEAWFVSEALVANRGNQTRTAERLGLSRAGLFRMLRRLGLSGWSVD